MSAQKKYPIGSVDQLVEEGGVAVIVNGKHIAVYNYKSRNEWYATDNVCPHTIVNVLSRGFLGDANKEPKITCPMHKKSFSLKTGECLGDEKLKIQTYPVSVENGIVYVALED